MHRLIPQVILSLPPIRLQDVGACGSDLAWRKALNDIEAVEVPVNGPETGEKIKTSNDMAKAKANVVSTIKNYIFAMPNIDPSSRGFNVTPKFLKLIQVLKACEPYGESFRGIIFGENLYGPSPQCLTPRPSSSTHRGEHHNGCDQRA